LPGSTGAGCELIRLVLNEEREVYGMAQEDLDALYSQLASRGVSRRDFLKYCGSIAALLGLSEAYVPRIASAVALGAELKPTLWLNGGSCSGCTESTAQNFEPDVATIVLDILSVNYFETVMMAQGEDAERAAADTIKEGGYIVVYEGTVMEGFEGNALRVAGRTGTEILEEAAESAEAVIAVGSCAVDGGWVAGRPNPAEGTGVQAHLSDVGIETPVINLPTCPVNPEWLVAVVVDYLILERLPELDGFGRPTLFFSQTIHDNCPRRGHFENGEFVTQFGSEEEAKGYCLYKVGCKGPTTWTNCPIVKWNDKVSWCVESGSPCIGCGVADPIAGGTYNWVDMNMPVLNRLRDVPYGDDAAFQAAQVGSAAAGVVAAALLVHGAATVATGRRNAPYDGEDAMTTKGGDE
jgi:hydrogenase small subunit